MSAPPGEHPFALCLTHDVDRTRKTYQSLYYGLTEPSRYHLRTALSEDDPYWQFGECMRLEDDLGVRSAFYFLQEQPLSARPPREWLSPTAWQLYAGRYDVAEPAVAATIRRLAADGWEVGLHGSYESPDDRDRLRAEKDHLERVLDDSIVGGRQHYLNLRRPETWQHHSAIGLRYDASLGSSSECGFAHGYDPLWPLAEDPEFAVFPLTVMDVALKANHDDFEARWAVCERLLEEAADNDAVMTVLWHLRTLNPREFPGFRALYRRLIERALEMDAWVGPPADLYAHLAEGR
jgi:hypothetical protein